MKQHVFAVSLLMLALALPVHATGYGTINNFDAVNDNGVPCHGFEIEIEDCHSKDVTYTYNWNHYGCPKISEDNSNPLHPRVIIRYESGKNSDGSWAAYTAVPSGPIAPTDGHQFTNPAVNFGGEHFGVGFYGAPTGVRYHWLVDNGAGALIQGTAVNIGTPTFAYFPPVNLVPAQVQAAIEPPPPPEVPVLEFGEASWVKEIRTTSHNNNKVELRDLVTDDPDDPNDDNWKNGEPDEVEVEWQLLQTDFNAGDGGANGELVAGAEDLPGGDEVVTRRYEFFKYVGPIDVETGEARADKVGPDGIYGDGLKIIDGVEVDLSTVVVVGDYIGAQMAGFDAAGQIGLIEHLQDGEVDVPYVERTMVIAGTPPIVTVRSGDLPNGMTFDDVTGVLSGTPTVSGLFVFTLHSTDAVGGDVTRTYNLTIADAGVELAPHYAVATTPSPANSGSTSGDGDYGDGTNVTVVATANHGFVFVNWTEAGSEVSTSPTYQFNVNVNRDIIANFAEEAHPSVISIALASPNPTNLAVVNYLVTFSEPVTGVDNTDFSVSMSGAVAGASIISVKGAGATRTVAVKTGTGSGGFQLNLVDNDTIIGASPVPLGGTGLGNGNFSGASYTIDKIKPVVKLTSTTKTITNGSPIPVTMAITSADGLSAGPNPATFVLTNCTLGNWTTVDSLNFTFTLTPLAPGLVKVTVPIKNVIDTANNGNAAASLQRTYDNAPPTVVSVLRASPDFTSAAQVLYTVTFSESVSGVKKTDFSLTASGVTGASVYSVTGAGATRTVTLNTGTGNGTLKLNVLDKDTIKDVAGNALGGVGLGNGDYAAGEVYTFVGR